ncbi:hypothetical protein SALBM217S_00851 [Streptomyces griseoloalbus]
MPTRAGSSSGSERGPPVAARGGSAYDELWWVERKMAREGMSVLPPTLALRKEAEDR